MAAIDFNGRGMSAELAQLIRRLADERNMGVLLVEHDVGLVMATCDRVVVIGSPEAAKAWSSQLWPEGGTVRDVVIFGAGRVGSAIARLLLEQGISVRMIEA